MSELTDLLIQVANRFGWGLLVFAFLLYQFYWPETLHPSRTKLQQLFVHFHILGIAVESIAEEVENVDADEISDAIRMNGYDTDDFKIPPGD